MSLALFRATLRAAIRDALAENERSAPQETHWIEPPAAAIEAHPVHRVARVELIVHDGLGARGRAP